MRGTKQRLPLPAGERVGVRGTLLFGLALLTAACGNYSNEDLEFMNAVPAAEDISASIPRSMILPANEAELSRLTHATITEFNGALRFLDAADFIRTFPPTSRIPNGRIWGPFPMDDQPGWQWHFVIRRDPVVADRFNYDFEVQPIGGADWTPFIDGWFAAANGVRKGVGHFRMQTEHLRAAQFPLERNPKDEVLQLLIVDYSTATFPVSVTMNMALWTNVSVNGFTTTASFRYHHEAHEAGSGLMEFEGSDSMGKSFSIVSRWMPTGRGRADAVATDGTLTGTWTQCWDDSFVLTYNNTPWDSMMNRGDPASCPDFSAP